MNLLDEVPVASAVLVVPPAYSFPVSQSESVVASDQEWAGERWADLRIAYRNRNGESYLTSRGLRVRPDQLPELEKAVRALREQFALVSE